MAIPTLGRALLLAARALRLRCPHCGRGAVLGTWGVVRTRCANCGFRFERSDDSYFSGAMFFNLAIAEFLFAVAFLLAIVMLWPNVPWDTIMYVAVIGMLMTPIVLYPFSKVVWLALDVFLRPVTADELTR